MWSVLECPKQTTYLYGAHDAARLHSGCFLGLVFRRCREPSVCRKKRSQCHKVLKVFRRVFLLMSGHTVKHKGLINKVNKTHWGQADRKDLCSCQLGCGSIQEWTDKHPEHLYHTRRKWLTLKVWTDSDEQTAAAEVYEGEILHFNIWNNLILK